MNISAQSVLFTRFFCAAVVKDRLCDARAVTGRTGRIWTNAPGVVVSDAAGSFQLRNLKKEQSLTTPGNEVSVHQVNKLSLKFPRGFSEFVPSLMFVSVGWTHSSIAHASCAHLIYSNYWTAPPEFHSFKRNQAMEELTAC